MRSENVHFTSNKFPQFCFSLMAGLSGVVIGTAIGWSSPITRLLVEGNENDGSGSDIGNGGGVGNDEDGFRDQVTWRITGSYCLGSTVGGLVQSLMIARLGFRWSAVACDSIVMIGWLILFLWQVDYTPVSCQAIWVGRLIQGFGSGGLGLSTPTYISHITDFDIRGRAQVFHQAFVCFGVLYSYAFGGILTYFQLTGACMIWPIVHSFLVFFFLPESPCHLYARRADTESVKTVMCRIKGSELYDVDTDYSVLRKYVKNFRYDKSGTDTNKNKWTIRRFCRTFTLGAGLMVFQQACGVNVLLFHADEIFGRFTQSYDTTTKAQIITIGTCMIQVFLCLISVELVECLGRKVVLIVSAVGMGFCLSTLTICHILSSGNLDIVENERHEDISIILVILYVCSYSVGWGPVVMLLYTEIVYVDKWFSSMFYAGGQFVMFLLVYVFFNADALRGNTYVLWVYITACTLSIAFVWGCVPETQAKSLYQISVHRHGWCRDFDNTSTKRRGRSI